MFGFIQTKYRENERLTHSAEDSKVCCVFKTKSVALSCLTAKVVCFIGLLFLGSPINEAQFYRYNTHWPASGEITFLSRLACTDVADYLSLAEVGYNSQSRLCAFYPLWPRLLSITGIAGSKIAPLGSTLLAILFWSIGLTLLYHWVRNRYNTQSAWAVILANLLLPSSVFFWLGYTEALFFLILVVFLTSSESENCFFSVIASLLLPIIRPVGIFIVSISFLGLFEKSSASTKRSLVQLLASLIGFGFYLTLMWLSTGNAWEGFEAQKYYINSPSLSHLFYPLELFSRFIAVDGWHTPKGSALDRIVFVGSVALMFYVWERWSRWFIWTLLMILIPVFTNWFLSYSRFAISILPLTLALGCWMQQCGRRMIWVIIALSLVNQAYLLNQYFSFHWAS